MTRPNVVRLDPDRRTRRNTQRAIEAALNHCIDAATGMLRTELPLRAITAAHDLVATGLPAQSMGEPGGGHGGHGDPTLGAVLNNDWVSTNIRQVQTDLEAAAALIASARNRLGNVAAQTDTRPEADPAGAGHCQRCNAWVTGSTTDRVRSGYCGACYQAWRRAGNPDRAQFNASHNGPA